MINFQIDDFIGDGKGSCLDIDEPCGDECKMATSVQQQTLAQGYKQLNYFLILYFYNLQIYLVFSIMSITPLSSGYVLM